MSELRAQHTLYYCSRKDRNSRGPGALIYHAQEAFAHSALPLITVVSYQVSVPLDLFAAQNEIMYRGGGARPRPQILPSYKGAHTVLDVEQLGNLQRQAGTTRQPSYFRSAQDPSGHFR